MFFKEFWKDFGFSNVKKNYENTELDKIELLMNLINRTLSTEIEYYQETQNIK